ncbi:hypothetical protein J4457_06330 [Candidatus Woesearchaeota archaeon]|nr:hypothetical protein [Candidatus Woesearchaeota archaeon]
MKYFIIFWALLVVLVACTPTEPQQPIEQSKPVETTMQDMPSDCAGLKDPFQGFCVFRTASDTMDDKLCRLIKDEELLIFCLDHIENKKEQDLIQEKINIGTIEACKELSDDKHRFTCVARLAREKKDAELCSEAGSFKDSCEVLVAERTGNAKLCEDKTGKAADLCYQAAAYGSLNAGHCARITEEQRRSNCYFDVAVKTKDKSLCAKSTDAKICEAVAIHDVKACEKLGDEKQKDVCVYTLALQTKEVDLCKKLPPKQMIECITNVAASKKDKSLCALTGDFEPFCLNKVVLSS